VVYISRVFCTCFFSYIRTCFAVVSYSKPGSTRILSNLRHGKPLLSVELAETSQGKTREGERAGGREERGKDQLWLT